MKVYMNEQRVPGVGIQELLEPARPHGDAGHL